MKDNRLLDGRSLRDQILRDVAGRVEEASRRRRIGRVVSVSIGAHNAASVYTRSQATAAAKVGLRFEEQTWPSELTQDECKARPLDRLCVCLALSRKTPSDPRRNPFTCEGICDGRGWHNLPNSRP